MRACLIALAFALLCLAPVVRGAEAAPPSAVELFTTRVRPVLEERCIECHGELRHKAQLKLNDRRTMISGGANGPAIVPGDPDHSLLMQRVRARGTDDVMPPREPALDDRQIADLAAWIAAGAPWVHADGSVEGGTASGGGTTPPTDGHPSPESAEANTKPPSNAGQHRPPLVGRIHPLVVHFPIACLLLVLLAEFLYVVRGPAWGPAVALLMLVGVAGAAVAVFTGTWFADEGSMFQRPDRTLRLHEVAGWVTLVLALASSAFLLASRSSPRARLFFRLLLVLTAVVSGLTGHLGGTMVYGEHWLF
jgi:uncharacterized membrane protein/mono/diheme cytochrome c family protein